ncbi:hypothetical protein LguiA_005303 [Lonicera macranthoides]
MLESKNSLEVLDFSILHYLFMMVRYLVSKGDVWIGKNKYGLTALDIINRSSEGSDDDTKQIHTLLERRKEKGEHMMENFFENKRNDVLVASSIIVFMTCRTGLNPPGGVFQEDKRDPNGDLISPMGTSVMAFTNPYMYVMFSVV